MNIRLFNSVMIKAKWWLIFIILIAVFLRIYHLDNVPAGFFADEASVGYNAYTILKKGTDEFGVSHPVYFRAFGEYKNPVEIYSTVPIIAWLGLNEFSVRLTSVIYGLLGIIALYLLTKEFFKQSQHANQIALFAAFFLAINPWHIHISRMSVEGLMPWVLFTTLGLYFFLKAQGKPRFLLASVATFAAALYCYFPARLFVPLFTLILSLIYLPFYFKHIILSLISLFLLIILLTPYLINMSSPAGWARWEQVSIFSNPPGNESIFTHIVNNYLSHFSLDYLFTKGEIGLPGRSILRYSVGGVGELFLFQLPLIFLGIINLVKNHQINILRILAAWLIIYPIGNIFTFDKTPQATRSIIGVIPFTILTAYGLSYLLNLGRGHIKKLLLITSTAVIGLSVVLFLNLYFVKYPLYSSGYWGWQYGPKGIMNYFLQVKDSYDELYLSNEFNGPEIFIKFYDPQNLCQNKCRVGNLDFSIYNPSKHQLFALSPQYFYTSSFSKCFNIKQQVFYPNKEVAFIVGEVNNDYNCLSLSMKE